MSFNTVDRCHVGGTQVHHFEVLLDPAALLSERATVCITGIHTGNHHLDRNPTMQ